MLIVVDEDFSIAEGKLDAAGFKKMLWPYGTRGPPAESGNEVAEHIYTTALQTYRHLNENSVRYEFPYDRFQGAKIIVVIRNSYAHISPPVKNHPDMTSGFHYVEGNLYWPDVPSLLTSVIQTLLQEDGGSLWRATLQAWAIPYLYGLPDVSLDVLDHCPDKAVRQWFDEHSHRSEGGLDKTRTKRHGKSFQEAPPEQASNTLNTASIDTV